VSALREAERLLDFLPTILIGLCPELRVTRWNRMAAAVLGVSAAQATGKTLAAAGIRWDWERVHRGICACRTQGESIRVDDLAYVPAGGTEGMLGLTIHPLTREADVPGGVTVIGADITERKQLERQLAQSQKLRSIGQLASGIAHEINTPTQYVGDNTRFLLDAFADLMGVLNAYTASVGRRPLRRLLPRSGAGGGGGHAPGRCGLPERGNPRRHPPHPGGGRADCEDRARHEGVRSSRPGREGDGGL
jgi:PAS domain S-box-containing protein